MGRTNPTFRNLLDGFEDDMDIYRQCLRQHEQPAFDQLFEHAHQRADAAGTVAHFDAERTALFSMLVGLQLEINELREEIGLERSRSWSKRPEESLTEYGRGVSGLVRCPKS